MAESLSPYKLGKARDLYNTFNAINAFSYTLLAGNIITLYAMRLNASSTIIGVLNAMLYWSYFFMPLGKALVKRFAIVKVFAVAWIIRSVLMIPLLFAPFFAHRGRHDIAMGIMIFGVMGFHVFRGIAMIGNNPVINTLARGPDRGSYITFIQVVTNGLTMLASFALALLLGGNPPLVIYSVIITVGIALQIFSGFIFLKLPEPEKENESEVREKVNFLSAAREAFAEISFRRFVLIFLSVSFVSAVARAFVVVYSREVFFQTDGMVSLFTVFGGLGALSMGLIVKFLVDRIGAKPLYITSTIVGLISLVPALFLFGRMMESPATVILFLACIHFLISFGFMGAEGVAQTYFFALIPSKHTLNLGILYYFVYGFAGGAGAFLGGLLLDGLSYLGFTVFISYKILFGLLLLILALTIIMQRKMVSLGALSFKSALEVMFSFRDIKAITILDRLARTIDSEEEAELLEALHETPSALATHGLLLRSNSPRLSIRIESLKALERLKSLSEEAVEALKEDIEKHPYTTAYISARILGSHGVFSAIPLIRSKLQSEDYLLTGDCMLALAKLNDTESLPEIEAYVKKTSNPRLKIMGVSALGVYASPNSIPVLFDLVRIKDPPPYLIDEVALSISQILDIQNFFYPLLIKFNENPEMALTLAMDEVEAAGEAVKPSKKGLFSSSKEQRERKRHNENVRELEKAVRAYMKDLDGAPLSAWILELPEDPQNEITQALLSEAVLDGELIVLPRLRLLICQWAAHQFKIAAAKAAKTLKDLYNTKH